MHVVAASAVAVVVVDDAQLMGHLSALWGKIGFKKPHVNISWVSLTGKLPPGVNGPALANPFPSNDTFETLDLFGNFNRGWLNIFAGHCIDEFAVVVVVGRIV